MATKTFLKSTVILILSVSFIAACTAPKSVVQTDQYHDRVEKNETAKALNGLQIKALQLMNQQNYDQAILYLQRAIKVEPRNPLNWHYLAQNYWHLKDYASCRSMIQRAQSYSQFDKDLSKANESLLMQCTP